jgi:signal transduction histidine kinase/ActR/RegA family two-component response regulator
MFGKRTENGSRAPQILRKLGIAYVLIVLALVGLVGYRQYDGAQKLKAASEVNASLPKLKALAERAASNASLVAKGDSKFAQKLKESTSGLQTAAATVGANLKDAPDSVTDAFAASEKARKQLDSDLQKVIKGSGVAQAAANAADHRRSYNAAVDKLTTEYEKSGPVYGESDLLLTGGLFAGVTLLLSAFVFIPLLRGTKKAVEFEQARFITEKEKVFKERNKEASAQMMSEIQAKQDEMKAQAEALEIALARAEEVNRLKTAFLANMSHEIRTPMNHVIGMAELLSQTSLSTEQREWLRTIISSGNQLVTIINDILDLSQIEAGKLAMDPVRFNLRELITDAVRPFEGEASQKGVGMAVWLAAGAREEVVADPVRIRQVLTNLISNSIKFTATGRIDVSAETVGTGDKLELRLSVKDTGIGIEPARLKAIFESFTQADVSTKRVYGGTGLGLTIVKQLAELMGGSIDVRSAPGMGSEFTITIPAQAASDTPKPIQTPAASVVTDLPNLSLSCLVVEDNPVNQKVLVKLLEKLGCNVDTAEDGEAAVQKTQSHGYDVILMDIHMPGKDGIEATRDIRNREEQWKQPRTPIVAVTADAMQEDRQRFIDAGMDDYVAKPVRQATLVPILSRFRKVSVV